MLFVTPKIMVGASKLVAVMPGVEFIAHIMTKTVGAGNSALQVYGVHQLTHLTTAGKSGGLSITALPAKMTSLRSTT